MAIVRAFLLLLASLSYASASPAAAEARLSAKPDVVANDSLPLGISQIGKAAFAYRPVHGVGHRPGLLVLFHGAGGDSRRFIELFRQEADRRQLVLLSIKSFDNTWDVVQRKARDSWNAGRASPILAPGRDARRVNGALKQLFSQVAVDQDRIAAVGFSDGASYALSLGLRNAHLFSAVVAIAPGFAADEVRNARQRIAIAHGRSDRILPFINAERIADDLRSRGYPLRFISFDGGHEVDSRSLGEALDFAVGAEPASGL